MPPATPSTVQINLPSGQKQPYQRVDIFQASAVGADFVMSCFQVDYQDVVDKQAVAIEGTMVSTEAIGVVRLIMDTAGFHRLRDEINTIFEKVSSK
jgi:hypothetical protein